MGAISNLKLILKITKIALTVCIWRTPVWVRRLFFDPANLFYL